jgi:phosphohistidine phosphatase
MSEVVMKRICFIRHAEAVKADKSLNDYSRLLSNNGRRGALRIARSLIREDVRFDGIISSVALRAFETATILAQEMGGVKEDIIINEHLYATEPLPVLDYVSTLPESFNSVAIVGHNPLLEELVARFLPGFLYGITPGCSVMISFETDTWPALPGAVGKFEFCKFINDDQMSRIEKRILKLSRNEAAEHIASGTGGGRSVIESDDDFAAGSIRLITRLFRSSPVITVRDMALFERAAGMIREKEREREHQRKLKLERKARKVDAKISRKIKTLEKKKARILHDIEEKEERNDPSRELIPHRNDTDAE